MLKRFSSQKIAGTLFLLAVLICPGKNFSLLRAEVEPALANALQLVLDTHRVRSQLIGISAAVVLPENSEWLGVSGMANPSTQDSLSSDLLLSVGSVTKTFTCAIILQLASENKLSLEDSLHKWLPKCKNIDSTITIRQLLNHTSGIYNYTNSASFWNLSVADYSKKFSPEELLSFVGTPSFKAGTKWEYSNTNYILLGMIIKNVTRSEFAVELHNRLLTPFNLHSTFLDIDDTINGKIADGWADMNFDGQLESTATHSRIAIYSGAWSAGAMVSTPRDLANWVKYLYTGQVFAKNYLDQMLDFTSLSGYNYGLATFKTRMLQRDLWGHSGGIPGYSSYAGYSKRDSISLAVILNRDGANPMPIVTDLLKTVINYAPTFVDGSIHGQPVDFRLNQNYPNPFNPATVISYQLATFSHVELKVFDALGREVAMLVNEKQNPGIHQVDFAGGNLSSGIYFCRMTAAPISGAGGRPAAFVKTNKMILTR